MSYEGERPHMDKSSEKRLRTGGIEAFRDYQREKNSVSIDGLPAIDV